MATPSNDMIQRFKTNIHDVFDFTRSNYKGSDGVDFDLYTLRFRDPDYHLVKSTEYHESTELEVDRFPLQPYLLRYDYVSGFRTKPSHFKRTFSMPIRSARARHSSSSALY